jgi:hypothetical protein
MTAGGGFGGGVAVRRRTALPGAVRVAGRNQTCKRCRAGLRVRVVCASPRSSTAGGGDGASCAVISRRTKRQVANRRVRELGVHLRPAPVIGIRVYRRRAASAQPAVHSQLTAHRAGAHLRPAPRAGALHVTLHSLACGPRKCACCGSPAGPALRDARPCRPGWMGCFHTLAQMYWHVQVRTAAARLQRRSRAAVTRTRMHGPDPASGQRGRGVDLRAGMPVASPIRVGSLTAGPAPPPPRHGCGRAGGCERSDAGPLAPVALERAAALRVLPGPPTERSRADSPFRVVLSESACPSQLVDSGAVPRSNVEPVFSAPCHFSLRSEQDGWPRRT